MEKISIDEAFTLDREFYVSEISEQLLEKMKGKSYKASCTVPVSQLRLLHVLHKNLEGQIMEAEAQNAFESMNDYNIWKK